MSEEELHVVGKWVVDAVVFGKQIEFQRKGSWKVLEPKFPI